LLSELVELRRLDFEELKRLEGETVTRSTVLEAERELLKAQLRAQQSSRGPDARDADRMAPDRERDTATLDRLIQLAEEEFAVIQARHEAGEAPKVEVWAAQRKLAEAKFGRAEQRADLDEQRRLLTQIVELRSQELGAAKQRLEGGTVPPNVVREAESALLEAQARLEALQPAGGADRPQPPD
jgi:outer membrane protein TolC